MTIQIGAMMVLFTEQIIGRSRSRTLQLLL
jgi:hypothetical protein